MLSGSLAESLRREGPLPFGSVEIISLNATEVHSRVALTAPTLESNPSGEYIAPRCP